jgi:lysophospholipase L1-like esterase
MTRFNPLLMILRVVLVYVALEAVLRFVFPFSLRAQGGHVILPVNSQYIYTHVHLRGVDSTVIHHKNSLGFRGAPPPTPFDAYLTLIALGGSSTESFYISDGKTWPELTGQKLQTDFDRLWINNGGLDGHSTFGHTILVRDYLSTLRPKVILFLVGDNDVGREDLNQHDFKITEDANRYKRWLQWAESHSRIVVILENVARAFKSRRQGISHGNIDVTQLPMLSISKADQEKVLQEHATRYVPPYEQRLETLLKLCRQNHIQPILITEATLYGPGRDDETGVDLGTIRVSPEANGLLSWKILELYNDATRRVARRENAPLIDLAHELPRSSRNFYDFHHFTNAGSEAVATIVSRHLKPILSSWFPDYVRTSPKTGSK